MSSKSILTPGSLAFIGLCNEYCQAIETATQSDCNTFVESALRLLPRMYIAATDLSCMSDPDYTLEQALDEEQYDSICLSLRQLLGESDTYLEVFEEDMKYSDTPIAASIAEDLSDIFQACYNFIATIKDAPEAAVVEAMRAMKQDFEVYWSRTLCNVMRALNQIRYFQEF